MFNTVRWLDLHDRDPLRSSMIMLGTKGNLKNLSLLANNGRPDRQRLCSPLADFFHNNASASSAKRRFRPDQAAIKSDAGELGVARVYADRALMSGQRADEN